MKFNSETGALAGKKSKRGSDKLTLEMRDKFKNAINSVDLVADLKQMEPVERLRTVGMLAKYVIPALASVELEMTDITVKQWLMMKPTDQDNYLNSLK